MDKVLPENELENSVKAIHGIVSQWFSEICKYRGAEGNDLGIKILHSEYEELRLCLSDLERAANAGKT